MASTSAGTASGVSRAKRIAPRRSGAMEGFRAALRLRWGDIPAARGTLRNVSIAPIVRAWGRPGSAAEVAAPGGGLTYILLWRA